MGDWCGPAIRHRMKRKQGRVTERSPPVRGEKKGEEENSFHGKRLCFLTCRLMGDPFTRLWNITSCKRRDHAQSAQKRKRTCRVALRDIGTCVENPSTPNWSVRDRPPSNVAVTSNKNGSVSMESSFGRGKKPCRPAILIAGICGDVTTQSCGCSVLTRHPVGPRMLTCPCLAIAL